MLTWALTTQTVRPLRVRAYITSRCGYVKRLSPIVSDVRLRIQTIAKGGLDVGTPMTKVTRPKRGEPRGCGTVHYRSFNQDSLLQLSNKPCFLRSHAKFLPGTPPRQNKPVFFTCSGLFSSFYRNLRFQTQRQIQNILHQLRRRT